MNEKGGYPFGSAENTYTKYHPILKYYLEILKI